MANPFAAGKTTLIHLRHIRFHRPLLRLFAVTVIFEDTPPYLLGQYKLRVIAAVDLGSPFVGIIILGAEYVVDFKQFQEGQIDHISSPHQDAAEDLTLPSGLDPDTQSKGAGIFNTQVLN